MIHATHNFAHVHSCRHHNWHRPKDPHKNCKTQSYKGETVDAVEAGKCATFIKYGKLKRNNTTKTDLSLTM